MRITLLHHTPIEPLVKATALPYQSKESKGLVRRVFDSGHKSIARHGMASFLIEGVSQSLLRQISRHPHINLTVKSTRYCDMTDIDIYEPKANIGKLEKIFNKKLNDIYEEDMEEDEEIRVSFQNEYKEDMQNIMNIYSKWKSYEGDEKEVDVAKLFLPLASTTDLVISGNYQALYDVLQLRNCTRTEFEFRKLSLELTKMLKGIMPEIFSDLGCRGDIYGICPETHGSCKKYPTKNELA